MPVETGNFVQIQEEEREEAPFGSPYKINTNYITLRDPFLGKLHLEKGDLVKIVDRGYYWEVWTPDTFEYLGVEWAGYSSISESVGKFSDFKENPFFIRKDNFESYIESGFLVRSDELTFF